MRSFVPFSHPQARVAPKVDTFQTRNCAPGDEEVSASFATAVRAAFEEDKQILEAVHVGMQNSHSSHIDLPSDAGPTRFRLRLATLIRAEEAVLSVG
jgi:vanillate O-demethylase monooxygenase subunit